ncbi:MAG: nucleotide exchange factor GrpE [candidate division Zixibacteria bacterium]|nr:nucleotide exchange factor GrpE [candidate division Zixibacteria bacterium]
MSKKKEQEQTEDSDQTEKISPVSEVSGQSGSTAKQIEALREDLEKARQELKERDDRLLRLAAEFDNYKKRTARDFENIIKNANESLIQELAVILNDFSRALESAREKKDSKSFQTGVELIHNQLQELLKKEGLEAIPAKGEKFDPNLHEAALQMESDQPEGTILDEVNKGYKLNGKVIKYSQVVVAKKKPDASEESETPMEES